MILRNGLVALCEGRTNMNDAVYRLLRREFMADPSTSDVLPRFVRAAQDSGTMWAFLKDYSPQWAPRRQFVRDQFIALIDGLERMPTLASGKVADVTNNSVSADRREKLMYNLFVTGNEEAWQGEPWTIEAVRCVNEYTDEAGGGSAHNLVPIG